MIEKLSKRLTGKLLERNIISEEYYEVYKYGVEIVISSIIGFLLTVAIGTALGMIESSLIYYVIFVSLRKFTGGFHANTYLKCNTVFSVVTTFVLLFSKISSLMNLSWFAFISLYCIAILTFIWLAPVENPNKPIEKKDKKRSKLISIILSLSLFVLSLLLYINGQILISAVIMYTIFAAATLCLVTIIPEKGGETNND